jgi:dUTP pyrophosphatase
VTALNIGDVPITIDNGERIAQLVIAPVWTGSLVESDELSDTDRGEGGFGSTGK